MKGCNHIFYTPEIQYPGMPHGEMCGDIMPFYWEGKYVLFFLYKYCIYAVETQDFVHYGPHRLVLQNGSPDDQDWHAATGSISHQDGTFVFYYTGFCEGNRGVEGKNEQEILRAYSNDLMHWEKDTGFSFPPDTRYYGGLHWRDPHVFWNEEMNKFCMLITATQKDSPKLRSGCTAVYTGNDMADWQHYKTIYAPRTFITHECQDAFKIGDWWYLTFSTYSRWWETRYCMAKSFTGPWIVPQADDLFDGREFYAAKTVSNGNKRYLVGWQAVRNHGKDNEKLMWGGNVLVHEIIQRDDGTLGVAMVDSIRDAFHSSLPLGVESKQGTWQYNKQVIGTADDGFGWAQLGMLRDPCLFETELAWDQGTRVVGLMIHTSGDALEKWCQLRIEITHHKIVMDRYNRIDGDQSFQDERPLHFQENKVKVQLITSGNIMMVYVNDVALTTRCYDIEFGGIGIFVEYGSVYCENARLLY